MRKNDWQGYALSILRIIAGALFVCHGMQKLFGLFGGTNGHGATPHIWSQLWVAGVLETFGGGLVILGLCTRCIAFVLCGEMAVAYFRTHFPRGFWPIRNGGELAVLYCFIFLYFVFAGSGPISLDRLVRRKK